MWAVTWANAPSRSSCPPVSSPTAWYDPLPGARANRHCVSQVTTTDLRPVLPRPVPPDRHVRFHPSPPGTGLSRRRHQHRGRSRRAGVSPAVGHPPERGSHPEVGWHGHPEWTNLRATGDRASPVDPGPGDGRPTRHGLLGSTLATLGRCQVRFRPAYLGSCRRGRPMVMTCVGSH